MFSNEIQIFVKHLVSRYIVVKDFDIALKYAKEFKLNCITADKDIVFSEAFLTKVGN